MSLLNYRAKLWMVNGNGEAVFGDGIADLIESVDKFHSILEAAKHLNMSYRYALHRITLAEKRLGEPLIIRVRGGANGGGSSEVTSYGKDLVCRYRKAQSGVGSFLEVLS
ncbi:MAG: LysR family transcriptional regulator [Candidatus Bathyarchaeota archaeon]|nr:LysR family transcriptional regulator [Candidatus Termiticorpusculum sp.]